MAGTSSTVASRNLSGTRVTPCVVPWPTAAPLRPGGEYSRPISGRTDPPLFVSRMELRIPGVRVLPLRALFREVRGHPHQIDAGRDVDRDIPGMHPFVAAAQPDQLVDHRLALGVLIDAGLEDDANGAVPGLFDHPGEGELPVLIGMCFDHIEPREAISPER